MCEVVAIPDDCKQFVPAGWTLAETIAHDRKIIGGLVKELEAARSAIGATWTDALEFNEDGSIKSMFVPNPPAWLLMEDRRSGTQWKHYWDGQGSYSNSNMAFVRGYLATPLPPTGKKRLAGRSTQRAQRSRRS